MKHITKYLKYLLDSDFFIPYVAAITVFGSPIVVAGLIAFFIKSQ